MLKSTARAVWKEPETIWLQNNGAWKGWPFLKFLIERLDPRESTNVPFFFSKQEPWSYWAWQDESRSESESLHARRNDLLTGVQSLPIDPKPLWSTPGQGEVILTNDGSPQLVLVYPFRWTGCRGDSPIERGDSGFPLKCPSGQRLWRLIDG